MLDTMGKAVVLFVVGLVKWTRLLSCMIAQTEINTKLAERPLKLGTEEVRGALKEYAVAVSM